MGSISFGSAYGTKCKSKGFSIRSSDYPLLEGGPFSMGSEFFAGELERKISECKNELGLSRKTCQCIPSFDVSIFKEQYLTAQEFLFAE